MQEIRIFTPTCKYDFKSDTKLGGGIGHFLLSSPQEVEFEREKLLRRAS